MYDRCIVKYAQLKELNTWPECHSWREEDVFSDLLDV